jgi:hypothetical protein
LIAPEIGGVERIGDYCVGSVREYPGVADVDALLPAELRSEADGVKDRSGEALVDEVGIVERIVAVGRVIVGRAIERRIGGVHRSRQRAIAGIDVLVEFLEAGIVAPVSHRQSIAEVVVEEAHHGLHGGLRAIQCRAAEERGEVAIGSKRSRRIETRRCRRDVAQPLRRVAAIGDAAVVEILVAQPHLGVRAHLVGERRIDPVAIEPVELPEAVASLVHGIQARGEVLVDGLAGVEGEAAIVPGAGLPRDLIYPLSVGLFKGTVEETTTRGATECDRARSLQDFDALRVVEIAKILDVVAEAVDEEVGARIDAADDELVAVAFALVHGDTRNVAGDVGEVLKARVVDEFPGHDAH